MPADEEYELETRLPKDVYSWRLGTLLGAGYDPDAARVLADDPTVDLHKAVKLVAVCPHELAARILV